MPRSRPLLLCLAAALFALVSGTQAATVAGAQPAPGERIERYDAVLDLDPSGLLEVTETVDYVFTERRRGFLRFIPIKARYDDGYDRLYEPRDITVAVDLVDAEVVSGDPSQVSALTVYDDDNGNRVVRIGGVDTYVEGTVRYTIRYSVPDTVEAIDQPNRNYQELAWNAVGTGLAVPIDAATVTVRAPGDVLKFACFAGGFGATAPCETASFDGRTATASMTGLFANEGMSVGVALPDGTVADDTPALVERWTFGRAFEATPLKGGAAVAGTVGLAGLLSLVLGRQGRDRRLALNAYLPTDAEPETAGLVGFFEKPDGPVRFKPPDGATPGLVGVIVDEKADTLDISATVVDLAVRGHLTIAQLDDDGDYQFSLAPTAPAGPLLPYEEDLLRRLFSRGANGRVTLGELRRAFAGDLAATKAELYAETMRRGWFVRRPDHVTAFWRVVGIALVAVGAVLTFVIASTTRWGLLALPALTPGIGVFLAASSMPARTGKGRAVLEQAVGFERFLDVADADQLRFQERQDQFVAGLPYAMVFGLTEKWAKTLAVLAQQGAVVAPPWFIPLPGRPFTPIDVGVAMSDFSTRAAQAMAMPKQQSGGGFGGSGGGGFTGGGGFSGGGGGGGGGGSW